MSPHDLIDAITSASYRPDLSSDKDVLESLPELFQDLSTAIAKSIMGAPDALPLDDPDCFVHRVDAQFVEGLRRVYKQCALKLLFLVGKEDKNPILACGDFVVLDIYVSLLRVLRNVCALSLAARTLVFEANFHKTVVFLMAGMERLHAGSDLWKELVLTSCSVALGLFVNLVVDHDLAAESLFATFTNKHMTAFIWFASTNNKHALINKIVLLIHNLAKRGQSSGEIEMQARLRRLVCEPESPMVPLLRKFVQDCELKRDTAELFDYLTWIHALVLQSGAELAEALLDCTGTGTSVIPILPEQLVVLRFYSVNLQLDDYSPESEDERRLEALRSFEVDNRHTEELTTMFQSRLLKMLECNADAVLPEGMNEQAKGVLDNLVRDAVMCLADIVGFLTGHCEDRSGDGDLEHQLLDKLLRRLDVLNLIEVENRNKRVEERKKQKEEPRVVEVVEEEVAVVEEGVTVVENHVQVEMVGESEAPAQPDQPKETDETDGGPRYGERSKLIRVVGNMVFRCRRAQDQLRELQGIPTVLNCCNIDDNSPFLREWGLFAVRNLTENNLENQKVIEELRATGVVQHPVLQKAGLEVEFNEDGSKPKVVKTEL